MVKKIVWLKKASNNFNDIHEYLITNWSLDVAREFYNNTKYIVENLIRFPYLGSISTKSKTLRKVLISKHNYLIYSINEDRIIINRIIDTRMLIR